MHLLRKFTSWISLESTQNMQHLNTQNTRIEIIKRIIGNYKFVTNVYGFDLYLSLIMSV